MSPYPEMRYALLLLLLGACEPPPPVPAARPDVPTRVREARLIVQRHAAESSRVLDLASARVEQFFAPRFERVDAFVAELFGFRGKWRAAFWSREDYERSVRRAFERRLFGGGDFRREVLDKTRDDFAWACGASENRMLADVHALVRTEAPAVGFAPFAARYREIAAALAPAIAGDTAMNVVSITGSEVAVALVMSAFAAAGLLAANSWWNFGIGLAAGVVVGIAIDAIVGEACEDEARMRVHAELVTMRREAVDAVVGAVAAARWTHALRQEEAIALAVERSLR